MVRSTCVPNGTRVRTYLGTYVYHGIRVPFGTIMVLEYHLEVLAS
jgi:hypothetical protein